MKNGWHDNLNVQFQTKIPGDIEIILRDDTKKTCTIWMLKDVDKASYKTAKFTLLYMNKRNMSKKHADQYIKYWWDLV